MTELDIDLQLASEEPGIPDKTLFTNWVQAVLTDRNLDTAIMTIRIVDESEGQELNANYRDKHYPTNVLSFVFDLPPGVPEDEFSGHLGDLVICAPVVAKEALEQNKAVIDHWAHLVIHGTLHLIGFDHIEELEADKMELIETQILCKLDINDPYHIIK